MAVNHLLPRSEHYPSGELQAPHLGGSRCVHRARAGGGLVTPGRPVFRAFDHLAAATGARGSGGADIDKAGMQGTRMGSAGPAGRGPRTGECPSEPSAQTGGDDDHGAKKVSEIWRIALEATTSGVCPSWRPSAAEHRTSAPGRPARRGVFRVPVITGIRDAERGHHNPQNTGAPLGTDGRGTAGSSGDFAR